MKRSVVVLIGVLSVVVVVLVAALAFLLGRGSTSSPTPPPPAAPSSPPASAPTPSVAPTRLADGTPTGDLLVQQAAIQCAEITDPVSCEKGFEWGSAIQMSSYATKAQGVPLKDVKATIQKGYDLAAKLERGINPAIYSTGFFKGTGYINMLWFEQPW